MSEQKSAMSMSEATDDRIKALEACVWSIVHAIDDFIDHPDVPGEVGQGLRAARDVALLKAVTRILDYPIPGKEEPRTILKNNGGSMDLAAELLPDEAAGRIQPRTCETCRYRRKCGIEKEAIRLDLGDFSCSEWRAKG